MKTKDPRNIFAEIKAGKYSKEKPVERPPILKKDTFAKEEEIKKDAEYNILKKMTNEEFIREQKEELKSKKRVETVGGEEDNLAYMDKVKEFLDKKFSKK